MPTIVKVLVWAAIMGVAAGCTMRLDAGTLPTDANSLVQDEWEDATGGDFNSVNTLSISGAVLEAEGNCICANLFDPMSDPVASCKVCFVRVPLLLRMPQVWRCHPFHCLRWVFNSGHPETLLPCTRPCRAMRGTGRTASKARPTLPIATAPSSPLALT